MDTLATQAAVRCLAVVFIVRIKSAQVEERLDIHMPNVDEVFTLPV